jgi:Flp pilus assembly protein TadG
VRALRADEQGGATVWGLLWFILFVGVGGLAVDITSGFQARTMLQSTADASALAGAIDLPSDETAVASAVAYASTNMSRSVPGTPTTTSSTPVRWLPMPCA